ncbi:PREDICTED: uncharacterized protein At2g33490-like [Ipomoea nil]|uniref:uncharacterized protein At2g33490-like n=1 Tax=Ipomoea nil TaxID=35883 RepID=UPI0009018F3A|nr:PREDICTED: uncharacterized protein At2g33490-like [Ipomoea nil]
MKSPLGKLKKLALHKSDAKDKKDHHSLVLSDGLAQASQDMKDMRNCYDSLLSAAAAAANSAYEFSESLMEMGNCLLEKITLNGDGESGKAFSALGRVQLELQKLVDIYRTHVIVTITNPSESLLNELRKVEEMKLQCDEKREVYEYMISNRGKCGKGENFTPQQLQATREEHDEMARLCIFRVESLKQGRSHSLLTQATRHHAAQLNLFRKGFKSLEAVDPQIRMVADKQHIDFQISEIDDTDDDGSKRYDANDEGELSFDYRTNKQELSNSMELDHADAPSTQTSGIEDIELDFKFQDHVLNRQPRVSSHSAPIGPINAEKMDISDRNREAQTSARKFHTYVLPTPADAKSLPGRASGSFFPSSVTNLTGSTNNLWRSDNYDKVKDDNSLSVRGASKAQSSFKESNINNASIRLPSPLEGTSSVQQLETHNTFDVERAKRLSFSGPISSKPLSNRPSLSASGPIGSAERSQQESGSTYGVPRVQPPSSIDISRSASPPLVASPKISELHELPRPPGSLASKPASRYSNPLAVSNPGSSLPSRHLTVSRSFSIPSSDHRTMALNESKLAGADSPIMKDNAVVSSPPLSPISVSNISTLSVVGTSSGQIRVDAGGR